MKNILLAEDDLTLAQALVDYLSAHTFSIDHVSSGSEAAERIDRGNYDLIVLDWELPEVSGPTLCKRLRTKGGLAPVLLISGHSTVEHKETAFDCGADDYISKPFAMREFLSRVKALLRRADGSIGRAYSAGETPSTGMMVSGKYRLERQIGEGGMASVWEATDTIMKRVVVLKMLLAEMHDRPEIIARFQHECRVIASINHPNIIKIFDAGQLGTDQAFLVMEFIEGQSLRTILDDIGSLSVETAAAILAQICAGLEVAHKADIVHRDIKPDNIMLQTDTQRIDAVKIIDFGISKLLTSTTRLTSPGMVVGSLEYMAPEQLIDSTIDQRTDIYSLGVLFFEMLTGGALPLTASTSEEMIEQTISGVPRVPSQLREDICADSRIDRIVAKALAKNPIERYASAADLRIELETALTEYEATIDQRA